MDTFPQVSLVNQNRSLEACKKYFFSGNVVSFMDEIRSQKFNVYFTEYKYAGDYEGSPSFILENLINGFVQQLDEKRAYLITGFKCTKKNNSYTIVAIWITNYNLPMEQLIPEKYDDFEWEELDMHLTVHVQKMLRTLISGPFDNTIAVSYLH